MAGSLETIVNWIKRKRAYSANELDRRAAPRVHLYKPLEVCFFDEKGIGFDSGDMLDLSASGVRFATPVKVETGELLTMMIYFPPEFDVKKPVKLRTRVIRCTRLKDQQRFRVACAFDPVDAAFAPELERFVEWIASRSGEALG